MGMRKQQPQSSEAFSAGIRGKTTPRRAHLDRLLSTRRAQQDLEPHFPENIP